MLIRVSDTPLRAAVDSAWAVVPRNESQPFTQRARRDAACCQTKLDERITGHADSTTNKNSEKRSGKSNIFIPTLLTLEGLQYSQCKRVTIFTIPDVGTKIDMILRAQIKPQPAATAREKV